MPLGCNGEGGIRTPGRAMKPYDGLANRYLQPLGHLSDCSNRGLNNKGSGPARVGPAKKAARPGTIQVAPVLLKALESDTVGRLRYAGGLEAEGMSVARALCPAAGRSAGVAAFRSARRISTKASR